MPCPLCDYSNALPSWLGSTLYRGIEFPYVQCLRCGSMYCSAMPDEETLAHMYGEDYEKHLSVDATDDVKEPLRVVDWLRKATPGTFIDYGCGAGSLLEAAAQLKWRSIGVEFDKKVATALEARTGARVVTDPTEIASESRADILHLGDVIEHLTDINRQMPEILSLIKPGGLLLAQGPLEGNTNLFLSMLRLSRLIRRPGVTNMAPYHVMLATARGQRMLFQRFGLKEQEYSVREVSWPAPRRLSIATLRAPRLAALFFLRQCSRAVSRLRPASWGNRYFYVGRLNG